MLGFFGRFEKEFQKLFHAAPQWEHFASTTIAFAAPIVTGLLAIYDPALIPVVQPIVQRVQAGLATLSAVTGDGSTPETVSGVIANIQANLNDLLAITGVKDSATQTKITATISLLVGELTAVKTMLPWQAVKPGAPTVVAPVLS